MSLSVAFALASLATGAGNAPLTDLLHRWRDEEPVVGAVAGLTGDDLRLYSGVGALHCEIAGEERIATAFLVGAFDVVVTVAHAFDAGERHVVASDCTFVNTGADGRVVERIRVAEFRSKWVDDPSARGSPWQDVAVARLERISGYARRTLPFKKFDGNPRDVTVVGYQEGHGGQWIKAKSYALADAIRTPDALDEVPKVLWPDPVPQPIISGAPVIDPASGAVIGLHQGSNGATDGNMLVIDEWLARAILSYTRSTDPSGS